MQAKYDEENTNLMREISLLKIQVEEMKSETLATQTKFETHFQEKLTNMENQFVRERKEMELSHEQIIQNLRLQMIKEGQELSEQNVESF